MPSPFLLTFCPWSTGFKPLSNMHLAFKRNLWIIFQTDEIREFSQFSNHQTQKWVWVQVINSDIGAETHFQWERDTNSNLGYTEKTVEDAQSQFSVVWLHLEVRGVSVQSVQCITSDVLSDDKTKWISSWDLCKLSAFNSVDPAP